MDSQRYLLDTNIVLAVVRQPAGVVAHRLMNMSRDRFCTSIIVASELRYGVCRKGSDKLARQVETVLEGFDILPLAESVDRHYGDIRSGLSRRGLLIGQNDLFIAAHARALDCILVTANVKEFCRVHGLAVENWLEAPSG